MLDRLKRKLGESRFVIKLAAEPVELDIFQEKPSVQFLIGISVIGFSYLMAWPFIALLGIISLIFGNPMIVAVGGPVAYGLSYLVLFLGVWLAGKDSINYMRVFSRWMMLKIFKKLSIIDPENDPGEIPR